MGQCFTVSVLLNLSATARWNCSFSSSLCNGARNLENLSPDTWTLDRTLLDHPGNLDIQLALKYGYQSNVRLYP
ncbi:MAG: hypothetical protein V7L20_18185 [Nostoc sp.]